MKKIILGLVIIISASFFLFTYKENIDDTKLTVGAILPLSGPAAIWGENVQKGIRLALENKVGLDVIYEDSKGKPAEGVSAFHSLKTKNADIMLSILSAVSIPVSKVAEEEKVPLFATLTAADGIVNPYTVRYYSNALNFASPSFADPLSPILAKNKIAVLYRNDDLGKSVQNNILKLAQSKNIEVTLIESFNPGEVDFNSAMSKVKSSGAEVLVFVPVTPSEATGIVKTSKTLSLNIPLVEASNVFADISTRANVPDSEFYTNVYSFAKSEDPKVIDFKNKYRAKHNSDPNFAVAFGYDTANMLYACKDKKDDILRCLKENKTYVGITGLATQIADGDFNVPMVFDEVKR